jgi:hypothetical protein
VNSPAPEVENRGYKRMSPFARRDYFTPSIISFKLQFFERLTPLIFRRHNRAVRVPFARRIEHLMRHPLTIPRYSPLQFNHHSFANTIVLKITWSNLQ